MNKILCLLVLYLAFSVKVCASDIDKMYVEFRSYVNHDAAIIILAQAHIESNCGKKGIAKRNGYNWLNITSAQGGRVAYEREDGRLVKKRWKVWHTKERAVKDIISYLKRKYPGALTSASNGNVKNYVQILKKGGYFTGSEERYKRSLRRARKYIEEKIS